jgi:hypothetical protein
MTVASVCITVAFFHDCGPLLRAARLVLLNLLNKRHRLILCMLV